jgi:long-chain fatty acid transport protein
MLLQVGFAWSYEITETFSIGVQPTFNYGDLELAPSPLSFPS